MNPKNPFESLVGEELNTVAFVMDYLEFHFNGPRIRSLTNPVVLVRGNEVRFPKPGSRDALCSLIGQSVETIVLRDEQSLVICFVSGSRLTIPLDSASYIGPEAMHWHPSVGDEGMLIW